MRIFVIAFIALIMVIGSVWWLQDSNTEQEMVSSISPNRTVKVSFRLDSIGRPNYKVMYQDKEVIQWSEMGFILKDQPDLTHGFSLADIQQRHVDAVWENYWGKSQYIRNNYNEAVFTLNHTFGTMEVWFRIYDNGIGFRYKLKGDQEQKMAIKRECTAFNVDSTAQCWWIPVDDDSYEKFYQQTEVYSIDSVQTPFTLKTSDDLYISIHEAALVDFPSMTLKQEGNGQLKSRLVPAKNGYAYTGDHEMMSPWRTISFGDEAVDLINSDLIENLNEPPYMDFSWLRPLKYMGIWWEMHLGLKTWPAGERHGATTEHAKEMIDFAADHGIQGLLVEGWNVGWDEWKDFDYRQAYADYNLEEVVRYGHERGVEIIMHNETAGYVDEYEQQIPEAFDYYQKLGIKYIKTGYVGPIKSGELHHGQQMVNHYQYVLEEAAKRSICILGHEHIKPTGLSRTWPNLLAVESARGQEYNAPWAPQNNPADHITILPFTRLLAGPMDYTPGLFEQTYERHGITGKRAYSTLAQQLALYVVYHSPAQMACDLPENYKNHPAFRFIQQVPVNWSKSMALDGEIGEYLVMARKAREGESWYIGTITNEAGRTLTVDCSFLEAGKTYDAVIYQDSESTHYLSAPHDYEIKRQTLSSTGKLQLRLAPGGGAAVSLTSANE